MLRPGQARQLAKQLAQARALCESSTLMQQAAAEKQGTANTLQAVAATHAPRLMK